MPELVHPGEHLAEELEYRGLSAEEFAKHAGMSLSVVEGILEGLFGITAIDAVQISDALDTKNPEFFLNLQRNYDLACIYREYGATPEERRSRR